MEAEVIVVGAGLAGLQCSRELAAARRQVLVLEASDAVGGRQRTDQTDGFLLDRGFQVLNPAYPAVRRMVDLDALELHPFGAGVQVRRRDRMVTLAHPLRAPALLPASLASGLLSPAALVALGRWITPVLRDPQRFATGGDTTWSATLDDLGLRGPLRTELLEPFLAGVLAERDGSTSDHFVRLLVRMFALGVPSLPSRGIQALPEQLADRARAAGTEIRLRTPVASVPRSGAPRVELADGQVLRAPSIVVAAGPEAVSGLLELAPVPTRGLITWWLAADEALTTSTMLTVDGRGGPIVNTVVLSNAVPSYAPAGRHLIAATTLLSEPATETDIRRQLATIHGTDTGGWDLLRRDVIEHALPAQLPPLQARRPTDLGGRRHVCGDHRDTASIQGALVSGHRAAQGVLAQLSAGLSS